MAETIISPGVLANENDQTFTLEQPIQAGAAIIGPTVRGKIGIPTICTSYSDYSTKYGTSFQSGSQTYSYFTSISAYNYFQSGGTSLLVTRVVSGSTLTDWTPATSSLIPTGSNGPTTGLSPFVLETISEGEIMNSTGPTGTNNTLLSGSTENFRWQITNTNVNDGTFSLSIRQGNDNIQFPSVLETWGPLSLDPYSPNYIEKVIGNQYEQVSNDGSDYYIQTVGDYVNQSKYVRIKQVNYTTPEYFDNNGAVKNEFTGSLPVPSSGSFGNGKGLNIPTGEAGLYYKNINDADNIQGLQASDYTTSVSLLGNKDAYKYNFITLPGIINGFSSHSTLISQLISMVKERGDTMTILDLVGYNSNITPVLTQAGTRDTSYAASYWPWIKILDPNTAVQAWVPPSTIIPSVYAQNDVIAYPWFAPAGVNRGVMPTVIQTERILTQGNRDDLYKNKVNPIATLPTAGGSAVVVFGQKTLQKRKTSLDRVNVRRLLIELKTVISQIADGFVFEQNNELTRNNFLSEINPYLSTVQQQQGLTSFQVVIDETNNTPDVIDNNQLVGQIYLQPTRTAEFIILDFNILPTGATFPT